MALFCAPVGGYTDRLMTDLCATVEAALPAAVGGLEVHCFHGPVRVAAVGVVVDLSLQDGATGAWSSGEVVAVPARDLAAPAVAIQRFLDAIARLAEPGSAARAMRGDIAEATGLDAPDYPDDAFAPTAADEARREAAARAIDGRFQAASARLREGHGLRLPRHLGVLAAFLRGLSPVEARALRAYGYSAIGLLDLFADGGLEREVAPGADLRLHWRFRRDPPELVSVLLGDSDGLHFGLWYDDPAELPSFVVENYARDDGVSKSHGCTTVLRHLEHRLKLRAEDAEHPPTALDRAFAAALDAARPADDAAVAADGPLRWAKCERLDSVLGVGPALPGGLATAHWPSYEPSRTREARYELRALRVARYVREARAALAAGRPGPALVVGRELFWADDEGYRAEVRELLGGAYEALGRGALAEILRVHLAGRDRPSVDVYREV